MLEGCLAYEVEKEDRLLERLAYQVVGIMLSSGNYKKNTKQRDLVDSIYKSMSEYMNEQEPTVKKREIITDKAKAAQFVRDLAKTFN